MKTQDKWTLGYLQSREHDNTIPAENKNIHFEQTKEQLDNSKYTQKINHGDWQGLFYWHFSESQNEFTPRIELPVADVSEARQFSPGMFHRSDIVDSFTIRNVGSWSGAVPCVQTSQSGNVMPIHSKSGGVDGAYAPKQMKFKGFTGESVADIHNADRDVIKCATGTRQPSGFPMIAVQCLNSEHYEIIAFPTGNLLALDNNSSGLSTKVAKVGADGNIETDGEIASLGSMLLIVRDFLGGKVVAMQCGISGEDDEVGHAPVIVNDQGGGKHLAYLGHIAGGPFIAAASPHPSMIISAESTDEYQDTQKLSFIDEVPYYQDDFRHGPLAFSQREFPVISGDEEVKEVILGFDPVTRTWRWFVDEETAQVLTARVAWCHDGTEDLSEGEITVDIENNVIWIDEAQSQVDFFTVGDNTIYVVSLVQKDFTRNGITRDLYRVVAVRADEGEKIRFLQAVDKDQLLFRAVRGDAPWLEGSPEITTDIAGNAKENIFRVRIPAQWDLTGGENYEYLELNSEKVFRGLYAPVRPSPKTAETFTQDGVMSSLEIANDSPIAEYKIKVDRGNKDGRHNAVTVGAEMMPRFGDSEQSVILNNIDQENTKICRVVSYTEATGEMIAENLFNPDQKFTVGCFLKGIPDLRPPQDSVRPSGLVQIHRVPSISNANPGESATAENTVDWVSLFFLNNDAAVCEILCVDTPPLEGELVDKSRVISSVDSEQYQVLNLDIVRSFSVFSSGGTQVNSVEFAKFLTVPGTVPLPVSQVKSDCDTTTGASIYFLSAIHCKFDDEDAFLVTGNANLSYNAICCEQGQEPDPGGGGGGGEPDPEPDPDPGAGATCPASATSVWLDQNGNVIRTISLSATQIEIDPQNQQSCAYRVTRAEDPSLPADQVTINQGFYTVTNPFGAVMQARLLNPQEGENGVPLTHKGTYVVIGGRRQDQSPQDRQTVAVEVS